MNSVGKVALLMTYPAVKSARKYCGDLYRTNSTRGWFANSARMLAPDQASLDSTQTWVRCSKEGSAMSARKIASGLPRAPLPAKDS